MRNDDREASEGSPRYIFSLLLAYGRLHSSEGDVESTIIAAKRYLKEAGLTHRKEKEVWQELRVLLVSGFEAEAYYGLEEARLISKYTDASREVMRMRIFLFKAGLDEKEWLRQSGSSEREIRRILRKGAENRRAYLSGVRMKKMTEIIQEKRSRSKKGIKKTES